MGCIDVITDKEHGKVSVWWEVPTSAGTIRKALRVSIVDGKAIDYHMVWDSYKFLPHAQALSAQPSYGTNGTTIVAGAALFGLGFLCSKILQKKKNNVLLEG